MSWFTNLKSEIVTVFHRSETEAHALVTALEADLQPVAADFEARSSRPSRPRSPPGRSISRPSRRLSLRRSRRSSATRRLSRRPEAEPA